MDYIKFDSEITIDSAYDLIRDINTSPDQDIMVFFSSTGGDPEATDVLLEYFGQQDYAKAKRIRLVAYNRLDSAGFYTFFKAAVVAKRILGLARGIVHIIDVEGWSNEFKKKSYTRFTKECIDTINNDWIKWYSDLGFTKAEISKLKRGEDIFVNSERLEKIRIASQGCQYKYRSEKDSKNAG